MTPTSFGDLAASFVSKRQNTQVTRSIQTLSTELTTGLKSDLRAATSGDIGAITGLDRSLATLASYGIATAEATLFTDTAQTALGRISDRLEGMLPKLAATMESPDPTIMATASVAARQGLETAISALNSNVAGRGLFGGTATSGPSIIDAEALLADLDVATAGWATADDVIAGIDAYFAPGGGFETSAYLGDTTSLAPFAVAPGEAVSVNARADDPAVRSALAALSKVAILEQPSFDGRNDVKTTMLERSQDAVLNATSELIGLRAHIGNAQESIDMARTRNEAERTSLQMARLDLIAADPYETATKLEQRQAQLESLYTITARMSRLTLTNYL